MKICNRCGATGKNPLQPNFTKDGKVWCGHCGAFLKLAKGSAK